jgi:DNA-binding CsgD family transcriptional regulator
MQKRKSRAKIDKNWENLDARSGGEYGKLAASIKERHPKLTKMQIKVAALSKALHDPEKIAERLSLCIETIHNHRSNIRRKIGLQRKDKLESYLN